jgi:protocatechuate 4,5-dioxygenase alpha chain
MPMTREQQAYDDIPGTFVFDAERSRRGYGINMFCMSLMKAENRKAFKENEAKYLDRFQLTPDQREAILKRQYNRMLELGGNIYFTAKLGATDGHSFQHMAAIMTSSTQDDYAKMMLGGGRSVEGNRSKTGKAPIPAYDRPAKKPKMAKKAAKSKKAAKAKSANTKSVKKSAKSVKKAKARQPAKAKTKAKTTKKTKARSKARSTRG